LPLTIGEETRWLEWATWVEELYDSFDVTCGVDTQYWALIGWE